MHGGKSLEWGQWEYILGETEDTSEQEVECGICGVQYFARIRRVKKLHTSLQVCVASWKGKLNHCCQWQLGGKSRNHFNRALRKGLDWKFLF